MILNEDELAHYGTPRRSGRYPWGSGGEDVSRHPDFLGIVAQLRKEGWSDTQIAADMGMTTTEFRQRNTIASNARKAARIAQAERLAATGMGASAIAREMGLANESSVRSLLAAGMKEKTQIIDNVADVLRKEVAEKRYVDVGTGTEHWVLMGVSRDKMKTAIRKLRDEGYTYHYVKVPQLGTKWDNTMIVLAAPDATGTEVFANRFNIHPPFSYSPDGGRTFKEPQPPVSISSKRLAIRYAKDGGDKADGVIYVRPGVDDVSLGKSRYAQVRIAVDGTHYIKGMAVYKDDLPKGIDLEFNTKKDDTGNKLDALKPLHETPEGKIDLKNPFKSTIGRQHGVMNIVNEEGDWETWGRTMSSQMLSKQSRKLAREQLDMRYEMHKNELDSIKAITNPTVRKFLLEKFADGADHSAVHLEAHSLPRTRNSVILPVPSMKQNEVYAPGFKNGERVVLIRHPHGGPFEIPELIVNNRNRSARATIGTDTLDAIGIHPKVAQKLSGADFDGDTVLVIPNGHGKVKTAPSLAGLKDFDPQRAYPYYPGMKIMTDHQTQTEMGKVSNLITDMTIKGANADEIAAAVRHSMVVIDAAKHKLNWKQSELDNNIRALKIRYQSTVSEKGRASQGAATIVSRAKSDLFVPERKQGYKVDPATGQKIYSYTGAVWTDKKGVTKPRTTKTTKLAEAADAHSLSSGTPIEKIYADHSNRLKALANEARKEGVLTKGIPYNSTAAKTYAPEVAKLNASLTLALKNAPLERRAQVVGNALYRARLDANPTMDDDSKKKIKNQCLAIARARTGADKIKITITPREWEAIQAGAISNHMLEKILKNADINVVREFATPKKALKMTNTKKIRARSMLASGYTQAEVAEALGVSLTTLKRSFEEG